MASRILLVRHGPRAPVPNPGWVDADGVLEWRALCDATGISAEAVPPAALSECASSADVLIASDLPRAVESAERMAPGREITLSPLLRETVLDIPAWLPLRWPLNIWESLIHLQWGYRMANKMDAPRAELARAADAARCLTGLARDGATVVAVTHGVFRRLLAGRLVSEGWQAPPGRRSYAPWSAWELHVG
jgi:broad specificity phosphatase PhoE